MRYFFAAILLLMLISEYYNGPAVPCCDAEQQAKIDVIEAQAVHEWTQRNKHKYQ